MPISPDLAYDLTKATLELYVQAEIDMLATVARRLERGIDGDGWAERKLAEVQTLQRELRAELARLADGTPGAVDDAVTKAYNRGVATAGTDLEAAGTARDLAFGPVTRPAAVDALVSETVARLSSTHFRVLRTALDAYRDVIAETAGQVATGTQTRRQAASRALDRFAARGVTGFVDNAGRSWDLASYTEMSLRTTTGQAAVQGHLDRLGQVGHDLVIVSDAPQECEICRPWEGKILSISGITAGTVRAENLRGSGTVTIRVAGTVAEARADGLFHPNCRHSLGAYIPGATRPPARTEDPTGDKNRQRLREIERTERRWKRMEAVALDDDQRRLARAKVREWEAKRKAHVQATMPKVERYSRGRTSLTVR